MNLDDYLEKLSQRALVNLLNAALDEMQFYNGRTVREVILITIGAVENEDGKYNVPNLADVEKKFG
jgi:hypothetical protein